MKKKEIYTALGLMSGTSMDGVDASIVYLSDDHSSVTRSENQYFEYGKDIYLKLTNLRDKITTSKDLSKYSAELKLIEKEITLFHAKIANIMIKINTEIEPEIIGFHGQTIFHDSQKKISVQLGDGKLLSQLTKKTVVYDFRQNDLKNDGQGAPLTPIFHQHLVRDISKTLCPALVLNIGGISNVTSIGNNFNLDTLFAGDIAPGNCLLDEWIRKNSKYKYDKDGLIAKSGKVNELILNQAIDNYFPRDNYNFPSLDIKDFSISFVRGLSLEDGAATLTHLTAELIKEGLKKIMIENYPNEKDILSKTTCLVCGGGRKNKYLIDIIKDNLNVKAIEPIDKYGLDGDFIESQAFGYLAIRSYLNLPITYPKTTRCIKPSTGGVIVENY